LPFVVGAGITVVVVSIIVGNLFVVVVVVDACGILFERCCWVDYSVTVIVVLLLWNCRVVVVVVRCTVC